MIHESHDTRRIVPWYQRATSTHAHAWLLLPGSVWFVCGLYLDGWAHNHGKVDNTFFTPWHAVFYSGYLVVAATLLCIIGMTHLRGLQWHTALPVPLRTAVVAAPVFALAGITDLWWHTSFGFETGIEPLLSPPHLALAGSMFFIVSAPARLDAGTQLGWQRIPYIVSICAAWSVVTFMWQFNHPYGIVWPATLSGGSVGIMAGIVGLVVNCALTAGIAVWMARIRMPYGAFTGILVVNALGIALMGDEYRFGWAALSAGIISEGCLWRWRNVPLTQRLQRYALVVAGCSGLAYMGVIAATQRIMWPIHIWLGSALLAGVAGWCVAYVTQPRAMPPSDAP